MLEISSGNFEAERGDLSKEGGCSRDRKGYDININTTTSVLLAVLILIVRSCELHVLVLRTSIIVATALFSSALFDRTLKTRFQAGVSGYNNIARI